MQSRDDGRTAEPTLEHKQEGRGLSVCNRSTEFAQSKGIMAYELVQATGFQSRVIFYFNSLQLTVNQTQENPS